MNNVESHPEVAAYLDQLDRVAADLPESRRVELLEQIRAHLDEAIEPGSDSAAVRDELDRLGEPEAIVDEARRDSPARDVTRPTDNVRPAENGMATASFVLGIAGLCLFWLFGVGLVLGVLAVVLGALGMRHAKRLPGEGLRGRARTGLVIGLVATIASAALIAWTMPSSVDVDGDLRGRPRSPGVCARGADRRGVNTFQVCRNVARPAQRNSIGLTYSKRADTSKKCWSEGT